MDSLTFISKLVDSLIWPVVMLVLMFVFKNDIAELFKRLIRLKHKDTELEFSERVKALRVEMKNEGELRTHTEHDDESNAKREELLALARISPRVAILESWATVETEAAKTALKILPDLSNKYNGRVLQPLHKLEGNVFNSIESLQLAELMRLRNLAAHSDDFNQTGEPIEAYIEMSLNFLQRLEKHNPE